MNQSSDADHPALSMAAAMSVGALVVLGLLGGTLIVCYGGFETSPKRGGSSVFVPAPQAYLMAAIMYCMSCIAMLALVRARTRSISTSIGAVTTYVVLATGIAMGCQLLRV